jgi:hypothetical protein
MRDQPIDNRAAALLLDEERKEMLAHLEPIVINAYAAEYSEAIEFNDIETLRYLDRNLILSMSKRGFRSTQVVDMSNAHHAQQLAMERMGSPTYQTTIAPQNGQAPRTKAQKVVNLFAKS